MMQILSSNLLYETSWDSQLLSILVALVALTVGTLWFVVRVLTPNANEHQTQWKWKAYLVFTLVAIASYYLVYLLMGRNGDSA